MTTSYGRPWPPAHTPGAANRAAAHAMPVPPRDHVQMMTDSNAALYGFERLAAPQPQ
ncbi:hypothetical protein FHX45_000563 [Amycolatopsis granulosa]|nr:hypothetical protein [Amycolatopsis granulosa]